MYSKSDTLGSIKNRLKPERTVKNPFAMQWLDSCYQETLLPDKPWEKVRDKVALQFTEKIRKQEEHPERFQMILHLLGTEFKVKYFPEVDYQPFLLEPPNMHKEQREKLQSEAQSWMNNQLNRAAKEVDCNRVLPGTEPSAEICPEMLIFMQNAYNTFQTGLDRHLYQMEMRILRNKDVEEQEQTKQVKEQRNVERVQVRAYGPGTASTTSSATIRQRLSTAGFDVKIGKMPGEAPTFTSPQTEEVGESVKAVLMRDPRRFVDIARRLHGRQMPVSLRSYMWLEVLFKVNRERLPESNVEKAVRERFGRAVHKGMSDLKIKRATVSPISGLIEKAVKEVYNQTLSMQGYNNQYHVKDTCRALNVLYTYDRSYEPYLIHWLFPLEVAFKEQSDAGEHVYELAMYLDLLNEHCFPSWPQIYAMAERTMSRLEAVDYELYNHIKTVAQKDVIFNPKEFMVYLLHAEKQKATQGSETERSQNVAESMSTDLLADPVVFLRKWMGEGFVSVLDTGAVLFIWDQCFLQMWQGPAMENLSLVLLLLLRHKFMSVTDYRSMKEVFFNAPCKLYTADIQRAWIFVERGGDPADVPFMSRQRPVTPPPSPPPTVVPEPRVDVLPAIALKNINLILNMSATSATKNPWLSQIDPTRLKVLCTVFYGRVKLASKLTHNWALIVSSDDRPDGNRSFHLKLDKEDDFVFENFDVGVFEVEREQDAYPYALLRIDYILDFDFDQQKLSPRVRPPITLGWAKIPLFQKHKPDLEKTEEPQDVGGDTEKKDEGKQKGKNAKKKKVPTATLR